MVDGENDDDTAADRKRTNSGGRLDTFRRKCM